MARQFKYLNPEVQKHLDEVRIMSDNIRPGEGHNWIHNARGLQRHISNQRARKEEEKHEKLQEEIANEPLVDCEWAINIKRAFDTKTVNPRYGTEGFWLTFRVSHKHLPVPRELLMTHNEQVDQAFTMTKRQSILGGRIRVVLTLEALQDFFASYAPELVDEAEEILASEDHSQLVGRLQEQYGESPAVWEVPDLESEGEGELVVELTLEALQAFYSHYAPEKVDDAALILDNVQGQEMDLLEALQSEYGACPEFTFINNAPAPAVEARVRNVEHVDQVELQVEVD